MDSHRSHRDQSFPTTGRTDGAPGIRVSGTRSADRPGIAFGLVAAVHVAIGAWAILAYRHQINPDGVSYISIARKYLAGDIDAAINAYWSPLQSWLLAPLLGVGLPPALAARLLALALSLVLLRGAWHIARNLGLARWPAALICIALVPITLNLGMTTITADLLATTLVVLYLVVMTRPDGVATRRDAIIAGLLGGLAFLAKSYLLGFFLLHYLAIMLWRLRSGVDASRRQLALAGTALLTCGVIAAAWTGALSLKYGRLTMGSTGAYNHALHHPVERGHPHHIDGLLRPPNATAVSAWEDPTYTAIHEWSPFESTRNLLHVLRRIHTNTREAIAVLQWYSLLSIGIIVAALLVAGGRLEPGPAMPVLVLLLAAGIQPLGYLVFQITSRYLAPAAVSLFLLGAFLVTHNRWLGTATLRANAVLALLCASFALEPAQSLWRQRGTGQADHELALALDNVIPRGSRVASNTQWAQTMRIAFENGWRYFGELQPGVTAEAALFQLDRHAIDYFIVWDSARTWRFTDDWVEVSGNRVPQARIYRVEHDEGMNSLNSVDREPVPRG